jgi:hypothetical protein
MNPIFYPNHNSEEEKKKKKEKKMRRKRFVGECFERYRGNAIIGSFLCNQNMPDATPVQRMRTFSR